MLRLMFYAQTNRALVGPDQRFKSFRQNAVLLALIFLMAAQPLRAFADEESCESDLLSKKQLLEVIELTKGHELYLLTKKLDHKVATLILYASKSESILPLKEQNKKIIGDFLLK